MPLTICYNWQHKQLRTNNIGWNKMITRVLNERK